jgi:hypothetical protein
VFERPIVIGQRLRWRYVDSNEPSEDDVVVNVRTDREEGLSPEAVDYAALWIEAKYAQDSPKTRPFTIMAGSSTTRQQSCLPTVRLRAMHPAIMKVIPYALPKWFSQWCSVEV